MARYTDEEFERRYPTGDPSATICRWDNETKLQYKNGMLYCPNCDSPTGTGRKLADYIN